MTYISKAVAALPLAAILSCCAVPGGATRPAPFAAIRERAAAPPIVDARALARWRDDPNLRVVRVREDGEGIGGGRPPFISLAADLTGARSGPGLFPPPSAAQISRLVDRLDLTADSRVVLVSEGHPRDAARAWLVLRWAGVKHVSVLDGGAPAWEGIAPRPSSRPSSRPTLGPPRGDRVSLPGGRFPTVNAAGVGPFAARGALIDARIAPTYAAGHIPGARNVPATLLVDQGGRLLSHAQLRTLFARHGLERARPVAVYGNGGIGAALLVLALESAGIPTSIYWDSWPDWRSDPTRPVAMGDGDADARGAVTIKHP